MELREMTVKRIVDEGNRILLFGGEDFYYIIASIALKDKIQIGDTVLYEPYGVNFGWYTVVKGE